MARVCEETIVFMGCAGVGKSNVIRMLTGKSFDKIYCDSRPCIEITPVCVYGDDGTIVKRVNLVKMNGLDLYLEYNDTIKGYLANATTVVYVIDNTQKIGSNVKVWKEKFEQAGGTKNATRMLVKTKSSLTPIIKDEFQRARWLRSKCQDANVGNVWEIDTKTGLNCDELKNHLFG